MSLQDESPFSTKIRKELLHNQSIDLSKRYSSASITPSYLRKKMMNQNKQMLRSNEGIT